MTWLELVCAVCLRTAVPRLPKGYRNHAPDRGPESTPMHIRLPEAWQRKNDVGVFSHWALCTQIPPRRERPLHIACSFGKSVRFHPDECKAYPSSERSERFCIASLHILCTPRRFHTAQKLKAESRERESLRAAHCGTCYRRTCKTPLNRRKAPLPRGCPMGPAQYGLLFQRGNNEPGPKGTPPASGWRSFASPSVAPLTVHALFACSLRFRFRVSALANALVRSAGGARLVTFIAAAGQKRPGVREKVNGSFSIPSHRVHPTAISPSYSPRGGESQIVGSTQLDCSSFSRRHGGRTYGPS